MTSKLRLDVKNGAETIWLDAKYQFDIVATQIVPNVQIYPQCHTLKTSDATKSIC